MTIRATEAKVTPSSDRALPHSETAQIRLLETYSEGLDAYSPATDVKKGMGPSTAALAGILSLSAHSPQLKRHPHVNTQAALWVMGQGKALGNFGPGGYGIDGKWGDHTQKAFKQYMKSRGLTDVKAAKNLLLGEARQKLIGEARKQGWEKIESLLQLRQRSQKDIHAYRKIYTTLTHDLEYGAKADSDQQFLVEKKDFQAIRDRVIQIHSPVQKYPPAEAALVRKGKRHLIELADTKILAQQLPDRIKIYEELLQEMSELAGKDHESFTSAKRDYAEIAIRMKVPRNTIIDTLKYYQERHER